MDKISFNFGKNFEIYDLLQIGLANNDVNTWDFLDEEEGYYYASHLADIGIYKFYIIPVAYEGEPIEIYICTAEELAELTPYAKEIMKALRTFNSYEEALEACK